MPSTPPASPPTLGADQPATPPYGPEHADVPGPRPEAGPTTPPESAPPRTGSAQGADGARLGWLDALRGIAALVVAFHHSSFCFMPQFRRAMLNWFDAGTYGVMVFFLVSGYIIPASLERRGSVPRFWVSRVFRMYPLWSAAIIAVLLLDVTGVREIRGDYGRQNAASAILGHATMLQDLLSTPNVINVLWTLSYEMAFYLLVVALFALRLHRRSAPIAAGLAGTGLLAGGLLPVAALSGAAGDDLVVVLAAAAMLAAVVCASAGPPAVRRSGAVLGGALALLLVLLNGRIAPWEGLGILAMMFLGTVVYRAQHGQINRRSALVAGVVVPACAVAGALWHGAEPMPVRRAWVIAFLLAVLTFAAGLALRHRRMPRWLTGLGVISYSVYLLHPVLLAVTDGTIGRLQTDGVGVELGFLAVLLPLSALTYRFIEAPGQAFGRRLAARARAGS